MKGGVQQQMLVLLACFQRVKLASFMCQLALPIKKTNYHHVQELVTWQFVAVTPLWNDALTLFWSMTSTMATRRPFRGPAEALAMRPVCTNLSKGCKQREVHYKWVKMLDFGCCMASALLVLVSTT